MAELAMVTGNLIQPTIVSSDSTVTASVMPYTDPMLISPSDIPFYLQPSVEPTITPSESSQPVSTTNLLQNIQDMQIPSLSTAQNPVITQPVVAKQTNYMPYIIGAGLVLLFRR